eukprot:6759823-Alexandrium_andersonii.AAC.1
MPPLPPTIRYEPPRGAIALLLVSVGNHPGTNKIPEHTETKRNKRRPSANNDMRQARDRDEM